MATNVRAFAGGTDRIVTAAGGADSGYGTYLAVLNKTGATIGAVLVAGTSEKPEFVIRADANGGQLGYSAGSLTWSTIAYPATDGWAIVAISKATGTSAVRGHKCVLSGPTWTHGGTATAANGSGGNGWLIGNNNLSDGGLVASFYCVARWDAAVVSDADLQTIVSLQTLIALAPTNLWILDQASTGTAVTDYMGTGADQTALSGTTVDSVTIPNFDTSYPSTGKTLYPDADLDAGDWTTTPLWSKVDEASAGGDVISSTAS